MLHIKKKLAGIAIHSLFARRQRCFSLQCIYFCSCGLTLSRTQYQNLYSCNNDMRVIVMLWILQRDHTVRRLVPHHNLKQYASPISASSLPKLKPHLMSSRELFPLKKKSNASVSFISVHQKNNNTVKLKTYWESQLSIIPDKKNIIPYEKIPIIPKKISVFLYFDHFIVPLLLKKTNLLLHT